MTTKPIIGIIVRGGLVAGVISDDPARVDCDVFVIDYDTEGSDEHELIAIGQGDGTTAEAYAFATEITQAAIDLPGLRQSIEGEPSVLAVLTASATDLVAAIGNMRDEGETIHPGLEKVEEGMIAVLESIEEPKPAELPAPESYRCPACGSVDLRTEVHVVARIAYAPGTAGNTLAFPDVRDSNAAEFKPHGFTLCNQCEHDGPFESFLVGGKATDGNGLYRLAARNTYGRDGGVEIDDTALVRLGNDPGAYVQAWVWVSEDDLSEAARGS